MSWIREEELKLSWIERLSVNVIKQGPLPNHIAFIMDGNRRFSVKSNIQKIEGHKLGFEKLSQALQWYEFSKISDNKNIILISDITHFLGVWN
jgi:ditrans,polycis-polyprenyl diphosphate synthase